MLACDISFSRLKVGKSFAREALGPSLVDRVTAFVGNMFGLPFADSSIDVVWTSHAIEPNGGREAAAVAELLRVTRGHLVLFEPSYEANTDEGRRRMDSLGYVKGLPATIEALGGRIIDRLAVRNVANPLNPTLALVCVPPRPRAATLATGAIAWTCPATGTALQWRETCFFSPQSLLAYPVLEGVPLLRVEHAVMASALA
jgi:hypothetical protein